MKQSLMTNLIEFYSTSSTGGTVSTPLTIDLYPCGEYITEIQIMSDKDVLIRIKQDGRQLFPVRSNVGNQFFKRYASTTMTPTVLDFLWIPVNPNAPLTLEYCDGGSGIAAMSVTLTMASEDERSTLVEVLNKLIGILSVNEVKK